MTRRPRIHLPGAFYHVTARGVRKLPIYRDTADRRWFLEIVQYASQIYGFRVIALCEMGNHYHIVLGTPRDNLSDAMQYINGQFAQTSNKRHGNTGHLFEARFNAVLIQREKYLRRAARYVVTNPVRANLVSHVEDWEWSTYRFTAGLEPAPSWLDTDWIRWTFRTDSQEEAQRRYIKYVNAPNRRRRASSGPVNAFGSPQFKTQIATMLQKLAFDRKVPRTATPLERPTLSELFDGTEDSIETRNSAISLARMQHGYSIAEIARFLGLHPSNVSRVLWPPSPRKSATWSHDQPRAT